MSNPGYSVFWTSQPSTVFARVTSQPGECVRLMNSLRDPDAPSKVVYDYVYALKNRFLRRGGLVRMNGKTPGFDNFERLAIQSGIVETLFHLAKGTDTAMERVFIAYFAAEALWKLIVIGTPSEREQLLKKYLEHGVIEFCLERAASAVFIAHRVVAMIGLRILSQECFLADYLSLEQTSNVMKTCCECTLQGPDLFVQQLRDPATTWQSLFCFGNIDAPPKKAAKYAPRFYATFQENAIWTVYELASPQPLPGQRYYNDIMKHDPSVLDLLLRCCNVPRQAHYAELEVDRNALTTLVLLLNFPAEMVPGLEVGGSNESICSQLNERWDSVMEGAGLLAARPRWCKRLIDVWKRLQAENVNEICRMLSEAEEKYHAPQPFHDEMLDGAIQYRGIAKVALMRLITTMAHASERCADITNTDLLNLLPITQSVCQPELEFDEDSEDPAHSTAYEEAHQSSFVQATRDVMRGELRSEEIIRINDMVIEGPTSHIRLLVSLVKRGILDETEMWKCLPTGVSIPGGLVQLQQMLSDEEIKRCLSVSLETLAKRREQGNARFRDDKDIEGACSEYCSAAQLGAALLEFDEVTGGKYSCALGGVKKELVLNLGNAAEMSLGRQHFDRALVFASAAVELAGKCSGAEEIEQKVREKNERRVQRAEEGISNRK